MPMSPGQRQREVVSVIERALGAIEAGDVAVVSSAAEKVQELNELPLYAAVPAVLAEVAVALERSDDARVTVLLGELAACLGPGPLGARVEGMIARRSGA